MISILRVYPGPTQWASDVDMDGTRVQLAFQDYPPSGPAPDEAAILAVAPSILDSTESEYEVVAEDGYVA